MHFMQPSEWALKEAGVVSHRTEYFRWICKFYCLGGPKWTASLAGNYLRQNMTSNKNVSRYYKEILWVGAWATGYRRFRGRGFQSMRRVLDMILFRICCKNCNDVCLKKTENKQKRGPGWPSFKNGNFLA